MNELTIAQMANTPDYFGWLIEMQGPAYLTARTTGGHVFHWTNDPLKGIRFFSREQADMVMMAVRRLVPNLFPDCVTQPPKPVKHGWLDGIRSDGSGGVPSCPKCGDPITHCSCEPIADLGQCTVPGCCNKATTLYDGKPRCQATLEEMAANARDRGIKTDFPDEAIGNVD